METPQGLVGLLGPLQERQRMQEKHVPRQIDQDALVEQPGLCGNEILLEAVQDAPVPHPAARHGSHQVSPAERHQFAWAELADKG